MELISASEEFEILETGTGFADCNWNVGMGFLEVRYPKLKCK
jgi:hypothetical protein